MSSEPMVNAVAQAAQSGDTTYSGAGFGAVQHFGKRAGQMLDPTAEGGMSRP